MLGTLLFDSTARRTESQEPHVLSEEDFPSTAQLSQLSEVAGGEQHGRWGQGLHAAPRAQGHAVQQLCLCPDL